jgi:hypothetical protein
MVIRPGSVAKRIAARPVLMTRGADRVRKLFTKRSGAELGELPDANAKLWTYGRAMASLYRRGVS